MGNTRYDTAKGKVISPSSLPAFSYAVGCKCLRRNLQFRKQKVSNAVLLLFYHVTLSKSDGRWTSKLLSCWRYTEEWIDSNHHHLCHQTSSSQDAAFTPAPNPDRSELLLIRRFTIILSCKSSLVDWYRVMIINDSRVTKIFPSFFWVSSPAAPAGFALPQC